MSVRIVRTRNGEDVIADLYEVTTKEDTEKAIAFFLALLETIKWGFIKAEQTKNKNEINIEKNYE